MLVFLNGKLVPENWAVVSVFDRGFLYGDGLFETMRVFNGKPFRWRQHLERLERGAGFLDIRLPFPPDSLLNFAELLIKENRMPDSLLRLSISRGVGQRGYSPKGAETPSFVMTLHPAPTGAPEQPPGWRLITSSVRLPAGDPLAAFKTSSKLPQVLARAEADAAQADEALLVDTNGHVVEASSSNLFWMAEGRVCTPPLSGNLPGVTRAVVLELCDALRIPHNETRVTPQELLRTEGIFVSLSSVGLARCVALDGQPIQPAPFLPELATAYWSLLRHETSG